MYYLLTISFMYAWYADANGRGREFNQLTKDDREAALKDWEAHYLAEIAARKAIEVLESN
jgi:hypothetical protein